MFRVFRNQVHELEEHKRKWKKALKKESRRGAKKSPLWRTNSSVSATSVGGSSEEEGGDEGGDVDTQNQTVSCPCPMQNLLQPIGIASAIIPPLSGLTFRKASGLDRENFSRMYIWESEANFAFCNRRPDVYRADSYSAA